MIRTICPVIDPEGNFLNIILGSALAALRNYLRLCDHDHSMDCGGLVRVIACFICSVSDLEVTQ